MNGDTNNPSQWEDIPLDKKSGSPPVKKSKRRAPKPPIDTKQNGHENGSIDVNDITRNRADSEQGQRWRAKYPTAIRDQIPALDEPVPSSWTVLEDDFVCVLAVFCSHIQEQAPLLPWCHLDDPHIYLTLMPSSVTTRYQVARFLLSLDDGTHLNVPALQVVPCKAFRLEPIANGGRVVVDGELINEVPIQAVVTEHQATVCARSKPKY